MMHRILVQEDPTQDVPGQQALPLDTNETLVPPAPAPTMFDVPKGYFEELVDEINDELEMGDRPFRVVRIAGGYLFATTPQHGQLVQRLLKARNRRRLTQAALETLAIIAYRQPITRSEVDAVRGVNTGEVLNTLVEKDLVAMVGRSEAVGKPILYGTTDEFLRTFGLNSLTDLPKLREIDDLLKTATAMVENDDTVTITADHRLLRRQLAELIEEGRSRPLEDPADEQAQDENTSPS
jgi:segregation and condensation protein B